MAKRKVSGIGALDRQIQSVRKKISGAKKKASTIKTAKRKAATLAKLKKQYNRITGRKK